VSVTPWRAAGLIGVIVLAAIAVVIIGTMAAWVLFVTFSRLPVP